ncbi:uncharacterized protein LOC125940681 [Dermacentor silvarum]|uniref:uncharacterized protein LOC125940681 n=1 Tax=Dermacentor silvarum TaxID=543639 RepID=UPI0021008D0E|nr:uncharacterized protein LOC125940681 [Dermacentor silvarum]
MALLQSLCRLTQPTVNEISGIFNGEFRRALGDGKTKPSKRSEAQSTSRGGPSTSRGAPSRGSKKRGGKSGVLLSLTLSSCHLKMTFATAAALQLRTDSRLQKLDVPNTPIKSGRIYILV